MFPWDFSMPMKRRQGNKRSKMELGKIREKVSEKEREWDVV